MNVEFACKSSTIIVPGWETVLRRRTTSSSSSSSCFWPFCSPSYLFRLHWSLLWRLIRMVGIWDSILLFAYWTDWLCSFCGVLCWCMESSSPVTSQPSSPAKDNGISYLATLTKSPIYSKTVLKFAAPKTAAHLSTTLISIRQIGIKLRASYQKPNLVSGVTLWIRRQRPIPQSPWPIRRNIRPKFKILATQTLCQSEPQPPSIRPIPLHSRVSSTTLPENYDILY